MRLFFASSLRRFVGLAVLFFFAIPMGLSVVGCGHSSTPVQYCNAGDSGPVVGQVANIALSPTLATTGESLNYGQMGQFLSASATDCKGNAVSVKGFTYASTSSFSQNATGGAIIADINPANGQVCGGTWNRNTGGGIADYTTCTAPTATPTQYLAYVTATAQGVVSNAIPVYVHPIVTSVVLGPKSDSCAAGADVGTDCCPNSTVGTPVVAQPYYYPTSGCLSQNKTGQLVARIYAGGSNTAANNITCQVGHVTFAPQTSSIVTIDQNGVATANQPGATLVTATISNSSTANQAGYFATCPPASIQLAIPSQPAGTSSVNVTLNNIQPITATVLDTKGQIITGLSLEFNSTSPQTIPASVGSVTPVFPGSADITAVCLPALCNAAPFSQIGLNGNGKAITSNPITINTAGTSSTVIYTGSTQSQFLAFRDFTTNQPSALIKLPYIPNSMVINQAGTTIYMGSTQGLMSVTTGTNSLGATNQSIPGNVLAVSPDGSTLVVTDPTRQTISLVSTSSNTVSTTYNGIGTSASFAPDSQTVYITTTTNQVLTHSVYTDWQTATAEEVYSSTTVMVPHIGAFFAGPTTTDGRSYCPTSAVTAGNPPSVVNQFIPLSNQTTTATDQIAATTDGIHILGATAKAPASLSDIALAPGTDADTGPGACTTATGPITFTTSFNAYPIVGVQPATITGVYPASNSLAAFVTYTLAPGATAGGSQIPFYFPSPTGKGTLTLVPLAGASSNQAIAPVTGTFSTDNFSFYVGTSGDNQVHIITLTYPTGAAPTAADTLDFNPDLPLCQNGANNIPTCSSSGTAPVNLLVQRPKKSTS